jgi:protein-S-isoprenylcysteine O-methyltransferase Ste14
MGWRLWQYSAQSMSAPDGKNLISRMVRRGLAGQLFLMAALFGCAGTLKFWQAWAFLAVNLIVSLYFCIYFYKRDPQLLERRMLTREKIGAQKFIMLLVRLGSVGCLVLCGLDFRFGWTRSYTGPVPLWLTLLALALYPVCYFLFIPVLNANRFAASIIQVEAGQTVADGGPYRFVRHPLYAVSLAVWFCIPLALGSLVALPFAALMLPILIFRILNEEKVLRQELPGYTEYCQRTRCRLIPFVW